MTKELTTVIPKIELISLTISPQNGWIQEQSQNRWKWSAIDLPHCLQHPLWPWDPCCMNFIFGVTKKRIIFFQENSRQDLELVVLTWFSQISLHSSSDIFRPDSFSHFSWPGRGTGPLSSAVPYISVKSNVCYHWPYMPLKIYLSI